MSTSLVFLLAAVVLSVVGCGLFLLRHRKPTSIDHGIQSFQRELRALAPGSSTAIAARPDRSAAAGAAAAPAGPTGPTGAAGPGPGADPSPAGDGRGR